MNKQSGELEMPESIRGSPLTLEEVFSYLPRGAKVLDLGSGDGSFDYSSFSQFSIGAIDLDPPARIKDFPPNVLFVRGSASAVPYGDGAFDAVVSNLAFEHFADAISSLREIDRIIRDGGYLWLSLSNAGSFEDQLYRNLCAGGGHVQHPTFEKFLRQVYQTTSLKLLSYQEVPAGFTFLGDSEELRHLTWAIVDALKRTVGLDARARSGYIFCLQKLAFAGPGFREILRCCSACVSPDKSDENRDSGVSPAEPWTCESCGARNSHPSRIVIEQTEDVAGEIRRQWERYPETRPERLKEMVEERTQLVKELRVEVQKQREFIVTLQKEFDERGEWARNQDREIRELREAKARLQDDLAQVKYGSLRSRCKSLAMEILKRMAGRARRVFTG